MMGGGGGGAKKDVMPELGIEPRTLESLWHVPPPLGDEAQLDSVLPLHHPGFLLLGNPPLTVAYSSLPHCYRQVNSKA